MRTTLVMFALLLIVLTLLSSFGGSIRSREPFFEEDMPVEYDTSMPQTQTQTQTQSEEIVLPPPPVDLPELEPTNSVTDIQPPPPELSTSGDFNQNLDSMTEEFVNLPGNYENSSEEFMNAPEPFFGDNLLGDQYASV